MARIAIDAMGGDYAPRAIVEGALWAAQEYGVGLELVGRKMISKQNWIELKLPVVFILIAGQKVIIEESR